MKWTDHLVFAVLLRQRLRHVVKYMVELADLITAGQRRLQLLARGQASGVVPQHAQAPGDSPAEQPEQQGGTDQCQQAAADQYPVLRPPGPFQSGPPLVVDPLLLAQEIVQGRAQVPGQALPL